MRAKLKRTLGALIALVMLVGLLPMQVFAASDLEPPANLLWNDLRIKFTNNNASGDVALAVVGLYNTADNSVEAYSKSYSGIAAGENEFDLSHMMVTGSTYYFFVRFKDATGKYTPVMYSAETTRPGYYNLPQIQNISFKPSGKVEWSPAKYSSRHLLELYKKNGTDWIKIQERYEYADYKEINKDIIVWDYEFENGAVYRTAITGYQGNVKVSQKTYSNEYRYEIINRSITIRPGTVVQTFDPSNPQAVTASSVTVLDGALNSGDTFSDVTYGGERTYVGTSPSSITGYKIMREGEDITELYTNITTQEGTITIEPYSPSPVVRDTEVISGTNLSIERLTMITSAHIAGCGMPTVTGIGSYDLTTGYSLPQGQYGDAELVFTVPSQDVNGDGTVDVNPYQLTLKIKVKHYPHTFDEEYPWELEGLTQHYRVCTVCGEKCDYGDHIFSDTEWNCDSEEYHHKKCKVCEFTKDWAEHTFADGICTTCGYVEGTVPEHRCFYHTQMVIAKPATCYEEGNIAYYKCWTCNKLFSDFDAKIEITAEDTIVPKIPHQLSDWQTDGTESWKECTTPGCDYIAWKNASTPCYKSGGHSVNDAGICTVCGTLFKVYNIYDQTDWEAAKTKTNEYNYFKVKDSLRIKPSTTANTKWNLTTDFSEYTIDLGSTVLGNEVIDVVMPSADTGLNIVGSKDWGASIEGSDDYSIKLSGGDDANHTVSVANINFGNCSDDAILFKSGCNNSKLIVRNCTSDSFYHVVSGFTGYEFYDSTFTTMSTTSKGYFTSWDNYWWGLVDEGEPGSWIKDIVGKGQRMQYQAADGSMRDIPYMYDMIELATDFLSNKFVFKPCGGMNVELDYVNERFKGFEPGGNYRIDFRDSDNNNQYYYKNFYATESKTTFALKENFAWVSNQPEANMSLLGRTVTVVRNDSAGLAPSLQFNIPARPVLKQSDFTIQSPTSAENDGKFIAPAEMVSKLQYSWNEGSDWRNWPADGKCGNFSEGQEILVRQKAVAGESFKSENIRLRMTAQVKGVTVSGRIKSYNPKNETTVKLMQGDEVKYTHTIAATSESGLKEQEFSINAVSQGTYDLVVTKEGHLTYTITGVTVGTENLDLRSNTNAAISTVTLLTGDINEDGKINNTDLFQLQSNFMKTGSSVTNPNADLTGDGKINNSDLFQLQSNFMKIASRDCRITYN